MEIFCQNTIFFLQVISGLCGNWRIYAVVLIVNFVCSVHDYSNRIPFNQILNTTGKPDGELTAAHCRPGIERILLREAEYVSIRASHL